MDQSANTPHWLDLYASKDLEWQLEIENDSNFEIYSRRLGIVESMFDSDGVYWEGRADVRPNLMVELKTTLNQKQLQDRITLMWTVLCHKRVLLSCRSTYASTPTQSRHCWNQKRFVYRRPQTAAQAVTEARKRISFVERKGSSIDEREFYAHVSNTRRAFDAEKALSRLFVLPVRTNQHGKLEMRLIMVLAHEITDGITQYRIANDIIQLLNENCEMLQGELQKLLAEDSLGLLSRLPAAQESLYPQRGQTRARRRWQWAISRILRHVRIPPPAAFPNPLLRDTPLQTAESFPKLYPEVLDYSRVPPLNTLSLGAEMSRLATHNMARMCREAGISVGSGCFTLVAMVMMHLEELRHPNIPLDKRLPFVGGFPVNPRPFLSGKATSGAEDSCMLAFSDGVTLPFLPQELDFQGRFRVLGRLAHRQLRQYQKRKRSVADEAHMGSRSPAQLLPSLYLSTLERMEARIGTVDPHRKIGLNICGSYPPAQSPTLATCGISSVGDTSGLIGPGKFDVQNLNGKDLVVDYRTMTSGVRAREGEFLVGAAGTKDSLGFMVSIDTNAIDPAKAMTWKAMMEGILDKQMYTDVQGSSSDPVEFPRESKL